MGDFGMQDVYTLHIKRHRGPNRIISPNCEACQKGFIHVNTLQVRQFTQSGKLPGVCMSCNSQFLKICRSQIRNMNHIENHSHECEMCGKTFTHAGNYLKHKRLHEAATHANLQTIEIMKAKLENAVSKTDEVVQVKVERDKIKTEKKIENKQQVIDTKQEKSDIETHSIEDLNTENDQNIENEVENTETEVVITKTEVHDTEIETQSIEDKDNETETLGTENDVQNMETETQDAEEECTELESTAEKVSKAVPVSQPKSDPPYTCTTCNKVFKKYGAYVSHCETHKGPLVCPICERLCNTRALLKTHFERCESRQPVYMCHYCEKGFNTKSSLKTHLETHAISQETHVCKFCKQTFVIAEELEVHLLEHINNTNIDIEEDSAKKVNEIRLNAPPVVKPNHYCYECGKGFVHLGKLKTHMADHNKNVPFECTSCKKLFVQSYRLVKHIKTCCKLHDLPVYPCNVCNKTFNYPNSLRRHKMLHKKPGHRYSS